MRETKFTPGPWNYQEESDVYTHIVRSPSNGLIVHLRQDTSGVSEATARLISAAPELFFLLEKAACPNARCVDGSIPHQVGDNEWEAEQCQWCDEREKALFKARGSHE